MGRHILFGVSLATLALAGCAYGPSEVASAAPPPAPIAAPSSTAPTPSAPQPPIAARRDHAVTTPFGVSRNDPYYWLRDDTRQSAEVLAYLRAENSYADAMTAPLAPLRDRLVQELTARVQPDETSLPTLDNGYYYYSRFAPGAEYPIHARRRGNLQAPEQVLLDVGAMGQGKGYYSVGDYEVAPNDRILAYVDDSVGRRQYTLRFRDLTTGRDLADTVENVEPNLVWSGDSRTVFYVEKDPVTLLSKRVKAHVLGTPATADRLVYEEADETYYMGIGKTTDDEFICIGVQSTVAAESRCTPSANPGRWTVIAPRQRDHLYDVDHAGGRWVIRSNRGAPNYRLYTTTDAARGPSAWRDLVAPSETAFIDSVQPFDRFIAINERVGGVKRLRILSNDGSSRVIDANDSAYAMSIGDNREANATTLRYVYTAMNTPATIYDVDMTTGERRVMRVQPVPTYDPANYVSERVWATARDGTRVPVSLFYRRGTPRDGTAPMLQVGYGSYGMSSDPALSTYQISLADRGVVIALAHIRGGQEMGRAWYDAGKMFNKKNSFTDFIDVTRWLVANRYAARDRVAAMGGSAGGLLMGAIANMAPEDYRAIVAHVPFVDVVTTMLDASIPLTTGEWDEWGNPANRASYDYMLSYSPYDQVSRQAYPAMFVTTGLHDSQVQYFEPAKWVAALRHTKTDNNPLIFRTNMEAGHGGRSGRLRRFGEQAEYLAFMLDQLGARDIVTR